MTLMKWLLNCEYLEEYSKFINYCKKKKLYTTKQYCEDYCGNEY